MIVMLMTFNILLKSSKAYNEGKAYFVLVFQYSIEIITTYTNTSSVHGLSLSIFY